MSDVAKRNHRGPVLAYLALIVVNGAMAFFTCAVAWMVAVTGA